jgi:thiamine biosynthesis lipoprotein
MNHEQPKKHTAHLSLEKPWRSAMNDTITERRARRTSRFPGSHRVEMVMGMPIGIDIRTALPQRELRSLLDDTYEWLRQVDGTFSTYKTDSQVSRLARGEKIDPSPEVVEVLGRCAEMRASTGGFFDAYAGGTLDPSGYVKGWAAERVSRALTAAGAVDHCVNAGGDVRVRGSARPGVAWRVGIRDPRRDVVCKVVFAHDLAVATSGGYARGAHIIDPHTGRPATDLGSVTVVGPDLAIADAYATALYAMGPLRARAFRLPEAYEFLIITGDGRGLSTPGFSHYAAGRLAG